MKNEVGVGVFDHHPIQITMVTVHIKFIAKLVAVSIRVVTVVDNMFLYIDHK